MRFREVERRFSNDVRMEKTSDSNKFANSPLGSAFQRPKEGQIELPWCDDETYKRLLAELANKSLAKKKQKKNKRREVLL